MRKFKTLSAMFVVLAAVVACCPVAFAASSAAGGNPFQELADWIDSWSSSIKVLVPAVGTVAILILSIVTIFAGSQWSGKYKGIMVGIIVGIATASYGPSVILALYK